MKKLFTFFTVMLFGTFAFTQNAIVGTGFTNGWDNSDFQYFTSSAGSSYIRCETANGTGNQYFRLGINWSGSVYQITQTHNIDVSVSPNTAYSLNTTGTTNGAMFINVTSTSHNYIFKTRDVGTNPSGNLVFFKVEGTVSTVTTVSISPTTPQDGQSATVTATLDNALSTGQSVYLRYSTDNFSSSTVIKMTGSATTYTASIPAQSTGTSVQYYVFTSGNGLTISHSDADFYTINLNNNSGSNYSYQVVLPVELTAFNATPTHNQIELFWQTASEENNQGFEIQRSTDAEHFHVIGKVQGAGNTTETQKYTFTDAQPAFGNNYYRLKQIDFDGAFEYSKVIAAKWMPHYNDLKLFPNPFQDDITVANLATTEPLLLEVYHQDGKLAATFQNIAAGATPLSLANLPNGVYLLHLKAQNGTILRTEQFIKR